MLQVRRFLILVVLLIYLNVVIIVPILSASVEDDFLDGNHYEYDNDDDDDDEDTTVVVDNEEDSDSPSYDVKYVYDHYYENQLKSNYQNRRCVDHRENCYSWRHLCPTNDNNNGYNSSDNISDNDESVRRTNHIDNDNNSNESQINLEHATDHSATVARWMVSHCPFTCQFCDSHQVRYNVPFQYTMKYEIEQKVRNVPNKMNLFSKINPTVWVDTVRDALTGTSHRTETDESKNNETFRSNDAIGIQYLMSTTTRLHDGVSYEQRNAMIQHIQQTQTAYANFVVTNRNDSGIELCRNRSPYCTYWAVVYDRCREPFYHSVMSKHCPITCQLCPAFLNVTSNTTTTTLEDATKTKPLKNNIAAATTTTVIHKNANEWSASSSSSNASWKAMDHNVNDGAAIHTTTDISKGDEIQGNGEETTISQPVLHNELLNVFESENCVFDPTSMPDIWYPNTYSVNQMFERIIAQSQDSSSSNFHQSHNSKINITILSRPLLNESLLEQGEINDSNSNQHNENQQPPWLIQIDDFLSDVECNHLIQLGTTLGYERSTGFEYQQQIPNQMHAEQVEIDDMSTTTNQQLHTVISDERTSSTTWCHHADCSVDDVIIQSIYHRIQNLTHIPSSHYESLQLLQYQTGQYYKVRR